jgi:hypothetical protein
VSVTAVTALRAKHHDAGRGKAHANFEENILLDVISQQQIIDPGDHAGNSLPNALQRHSAKDFRTKGGEDSPSSSDLTCDQIAACLDYARELAEFEAVV